ncbi:hypothetical protein Tco_0348700 [Tanacetum coccineum]
MAPSFCSDSGIIGEPLIPSPAHWLVPLHGTYGGFVLNTGTSLTPSFRIGDPKQLHANVARFQRLPRNNVNKQFANEKKAFSEVSRKDTRKHGHSNSYAHAIKLGTSSKAVKEDNEPALVLDDSLEGFDDILIRFMGGFWVMFQFRFKVLKDNFHNYVGVGSWFSKLLPGSTTFNIDEKVTWIDIGGVPLCVWSHNTFVHIYSKWGELLYDEDKEAPFFHRKRICIQKTLEENIFESFKIIKEEISEVGSDVDEITETNFKNGKFLSSANKEPLNVDVEDSESNDPFNIYELLNKKTLISKEAYNLEGDLKYPLGFLPHDTSEVNSNMMNNATQKNNVSNQNSDVLEKEVPVNKHVPKDNLKEDVEVSSCSTHLKSLEMPRSGGSILQLMDDQINETKMDHVVLFVIKSCWVNFAFDFVVSPSVGKWIPNDKDLLIISVYAHQELSEKKDAMAIFESFDR